MYIDGKYDNIWHTWILWVVALFKNSDWSRWWTNCVCWFAKQHFASCYARLSCRPPVFALTAFRFWPWWHRSPMMASTAAPSCQDGWFHEIVTSGFIQTILVYKHFKPFDSGAGEETKQSSPSSVWACLPTTRRFSQNVHAEWSRLDSCSQRPWGLSLTFLF